MSEEKNENLALWRFSIIGSLIHRRAEQDTFENMCNTLASRKWLKPDGKECIISAETIRKWLYRYNHGGLPALTDQKRSDFGKFDIPDNICEIIHKTRNEHPRWALSVIFKKLQENHIWDGQNPSESALYRYCKSQNLGRDYHKVSSFRSFEAANFGQLWTADFLHGPKLYFGRNKRKTYLHAIIDDCTRYVVDAGFYLAENVEVLLTSLKNAVRRFGIPHSFYTDNGAAYTSNHLKLIAANLKMNIPHTRPYQPEGRGKIERFFGTVRMQFLDIQKFKTLDEINAAFNKWLSVYHGMLHQSIKCTPLEKKVLSHNLCEQIPSAINLDPLFFMRKRCRIYNNGTVRLNNMLFEITTTSPEKRVTIFYLPWNKDKIWYGPQYTPAFPIDLHKNAARFNAINFKVREHTNE